MPHFSVIIPLYNKQNDIAATLRSVFAQTFSDFEVIVINDGSTDESEKEVLQFDDPRLVYVSTENRGVSAARNTGIEKASSSLVAFLDADDFWAKDHLETLYSLSTKFPEAGLWATNYNFKHPSGALQDTIFHLLDDNFEGIADNVFRHSLKDRLICTICVAIKKEVFDNVGMFDPSNKTGPGEDTEMWVRIALKYPVAFTKKVTASYNQDGSNRISLSETKKRVFPKLDQFAEEEKNDPHLKKYLDLYRADFTLKHRMAGDFSTAAFYKRNLDPANISRKARFLLTLPPSLLRMMLVVKHWIKRRGIYIDTYN